MAGHPPDIGAGEESGADGAPQQSPRPSSQPFSAPISGSAESEPKNLYVVGVGASAGGLEALQRLFECMPRTGGFAFVVVQHLSPDFRSLMDELLSPHTELRVLRAEDGMTVEADTVYLMPPKNEMIVSGGRLFLTERDPSRGLSLPIDAFFRSLAEDAGPRAIAVVLSGTGSDGSRGLRAVHEAGGLVIAQSEDSAKFDGMPRSAVDTGVVDLVLPPEEIVVALGKYLEQEGRLTEADGQEASGDVVKRIFELLRRESGIEFGDYKGSTVGRRIERRLLLSDCRDLEQYVARIAEDPAELHALYKDLLIGVTRFFRDPEAFERLKTDVLPGLIDRTPPAEELRVWVPACATGEEAYSLALLILEAFQSRGRANPLFRIFATDVHRRSLEVASLGVYPIESMVNVPPALRERYFERHQDGFQVSPDLRTHIVFAHHNLLRDAPFTRLDLLSCRNLLIYFKPPAQRRVLALFHFALKTSGLLLLGPSETPGPLADEFATVDSRWRIFRKSRDVRIAPEMRLSSPGAPEGIIRTISARPPAEDPRVVQARNNLLERYSPPAMLVDEAGRLLHSFNGAGDFLAQRDGKPSLNLLDLLEGELRFVVAGALKRAQKDPHPVAYGGITAAAGGEKRRIRVVVQSVGAADRGDQCYAVVFEPDHASGLEAAAAPVAPAAVGDLLQERLNAVEGELRVTKENLQATIEEMETSNEELQATNEELVASNEELQSTNEELHSVNEELYTVNAEYQAKISELTELTADMNHLLEATEVHTIFLDQELRLRKFTPRIAATFNLLPQDVGRRLDAFAHNLSDGSLLRDLEQVSSTGEPVQREVEDRQGRPYFLRVMPYRTPSGIEGVVVTLVDLSAIKRAQRDLAVSEERYRTLLRAITAILWTANRDGQFVSPQAEWEAYTGQGWQVHQGEGWLAAVHTDDRERVRSAWRTAVKERRVFEAHGRLFSKAEGDYHHFVARAAPLLDETGAVREWVGHVVDVHDSKMAELALQRKDAQIRSIIDNSPAFIWVKDTSGRYLVSGRQCETVMGVPCDAMAGKTDYDFLPVAVADALRATERRCLESGETIETEEVFLIDGEPRTFLTVKFPLRDEDSNIYAVAGIANDITQRKRDAEEIHQAVERRDQFLAMLSHELRTPLGAILNAADLLERGDAARSPAFAREVIRRQTRHMAKLVEDLLDVGRITRDQLVLDAQVLDLRGVVEDAVLPVRPEAERKGLVLQVDADVEGALVKGDPARLRQIFTNLLTNAIAYTPAGQVHVSLRSDGQTVKFSVRDSGIGMTREELARVFDLFYQTPQALDRKRGGLGVGLTLALKLARLQNGTISADSEGRGCGATFTVTLPRIEGAVRQPQQPEPRRPDGTLRIVLIEDNEDIRDTLVDLLRLEGHEVIAHSEGIRGAAAIIETCPDLALVDVGLPGMDGYAVAKAVRAARGAAVRLIALTGYGRREDRMEAAGAGFDRHIIKPIDHEMLMRVLAEVAAGRGADVSEEPSLASATGQ
jgi:two-component system, chemotaxis family, CheB/CheR fusion protein